MRRQLLALLLTVISAACALAQQAYNSRLLESLGVTERQVEEIVERQEETAASLRRLQADQEIKKAELARMLIEDEPDMRQVERNLRDAAEIEVQIRMLEIRREIGIRSIVGMEVWTRLMAAARIQRAAAVQQGAEAASRGGEPQQTFAEQQRRMAELQEQRELLQDPEIRELYQRLQEGFGELQRLVRERAR